ncbi:Uncharacterised protein [Mycobacteroides abscessus subsp. abscessus]|nr:Uncharacterised protein [Mycobacteroides abscessus subsp. abscessus]
MDLGSEQTAIMSRESSELSAHSRIVWESREIDGTRNSTEPPAPTYSSASFSEVKVLPVPHAMISLPRSCSANCAVTASMASR